MKKLNIVEQEKMLLQDLIKLKRSWNNKLSLEDKIF